MEARMIASDFEKILDGQDSCIVGILYRNPVAGVYNEVFGYTEASAWEDVLITALALHQYVSKKDFVIQQYGIQEEYDSIFYFSALFTLTDAQYDSARIISNPFLPNSLHWKPVPIASLRNSKFYSIFNLRIGQIGQVIPAKMDRSENQ